MSRLIALIELVCGVRRRERTRRAYFEDLRRDMILVGLSVGFTHDEVMERLPSYLKELA
jgi:hypothetical protein